MSPGIGPEEAGTPGVGPDHAEQDAQGGGLTRAVGAEEARDLPGGDAHVQPIQGAGGAGATAKGLGQALNVDDRSEERRVGKECRSRWSPYH